MSHSKKDAVGGHVDKSFRWWKKFNRREARREAKTIISEALVLLEADIQEDRYWQEANEAFYDTAYYEYDAYDDQYEYPFEDDYYLYDDGYDDPYFGFFDWDGVPKHIQFSEPAYPESESLGDILERMMKKGAN